MSNHGCRSHAPTQPELRQRILGHKQCRLRYPRLSQTVLCTLDLLPVWIKHVAQVEAEQRQENLHTPVNMFAEGWFAVVEPAAHVNALRTLSGKHEHYTSR